MYVLLYFISREFAWGLERSLPLCGNHGHYDNLFDIDGVDVLFAMIET